MAANQIVISQEAGTIAAPEEVQIVDETEILSHEAGTVAASEEVQVVNGAKIILSHEAETVAAPEEMQVVKEAESPAEFQAGTVATPEPMQIVNKADILSLEAEIVAAPKEVQVIKAESPAEARFPTYRPADTQLTIYHPTNLPREGEVLFGQDGEVFYGSSTTIPRHEYFQEAVRVAGPLPPYLKAGQVPPAPFQEAANFAGPLQPHYLQVANVPLAPMLATSPTRFGTGYYLPCYHLGYHCFNRKKRTSLESNEESAVQEEGTIVNEGPAITASEDESVVNNAKPVAFPQEVHNEAEVKAAQEEKIDNQAEEFATPEGEKTLNEAKVVADPEEGIKETKAVADPEVETIVQVAKVPTRPKKDNSRKRQRDRKEQAALREAATAGVSVTAGEIRAPEDEKDINEAKVVTALEEENIVINKAEEVAVPQEQVTVNLAKVPTGQKKCLPMRRKRMIQTPTTVVHGKPRAVAALIDELIVLEEAVAGPEEEKVVNQAEPVAASEEDKEVVTQAKGATGLKKGKSRLRQRERKREAAEKESVRAAAGEKQKGRQTSHMKHVWNSLKGVPLFIKCTCDKILFQVASLTAHITGYDRTPKKILKLRAELDKKVVN